MQEAERLPAFFLIERLVLIFAVTKITPTSVGVIV